MVGAEQVLSDTEKREMDIRHLLRPVAEWFHGHEGEMFKRRAVASRIADDLSTDEPISTASVNLAIGDIVGDGVDPVVQVGAPDGTYVGVVDYSEGPFWYEYTAYHTGVGRLHKVVCASCVTESTHERDVYAPRWEPSEYDDDEMRGLMAAHHSARHAHMDPATVVKEYTDGYAPKGDVSPADIAPHIDHETYITQTDFGDVETGATLVSTTTTTAGDVFFHAGNDGPGSGLDADTVDGVEASNLGSSVSEDGTLVTPNSSDLNFTDSLAASDDGDGTTTISLGSPVSSRLFRAEELFIHDKTLESGESLTLGSTDGSVVSEQFTVDGTLSIDKGGSLTVI